VQWRPSDTQLKILRYIQLQARVSASDIAHACGIKEHTIFYAMRLLRDKGLLASRPMINYSQLGYTEYDLYLRLSGSAAQSRARLISWANEIQNVAVLLEVGGEFQYEVVLVARSVSELAQALGALGKHLGDMPMQKSMSIRTSTWCFGTKCLSHFRKPLPKIGYHCGAENTRLTGLDVRMLGSMQWLEELNISRIARQLKEPASTIEYRLRRLEERGVIAGYFYDYSMLNETIGYIGFHLLVKLKGAESGFADKFFEYCWKHVNIDVVHGGIGNFDYKLEVRVPAYDTLVTLVDDIYERFEPSIAEINVYPLLKVNQVSTFPVTASAEEDASGKE
jgi:DNA-binding Lrp family transcriptional regulator